MVFFFFVGVVGDRGRGRLEQIQKRCLWRVVQERRGEERRILLAKLRDFILFSQLFLFLVLFVMISMRIFF